MRVKKGIKLILISLILISSYYFYGTKRPIKIRNVDLTNLSFFEVIKGEKFLFSTLGKSFIIEKKNEKEIKPFVFNKIIKDKIYFIYLGDNGKLGILDENLNKITEPIFETLSNLGDSDFIKVTLNEKQYLFNIKTLKEMVEVEDTTIEGKYLKIYADGKIKLLNSEGKEILNEGYENILYLKEEKVVVLKNGKYGVVDLENRVVIPFEYDEIYFANNNFIVKKDGVYYLNNEKLNIENIYPSMNDILIYDLEDGFSLINLRDKKISKNVYTEISPNYNNFLIVGNGEKYAIIDKYEKLKPDYKYSYITKIDNEIFMAGTDEIGKFALLIGEKKVTAEKYDNIVKISNNYFLGMIGNEIILLDKNGKEKIQTKLKNLIYYNSDVVLIKEKDGEIYVCRLEKEW